MILKEIKRDINKYESRGFKITDLHIDKEFNKLNELQKEIKETLNMNIDKLSIGMSNDYKIALQHHATHLRLGSILYTKEVE